MGFENLMQKAVQIRSRASDLAYFEANNGDSVDHKLFREIEASAADVPDTFQPFTELPDPAKFDSSIDLLKDALRILSAGQDTTDPISTNGRVYPANPTMQKIKGVDSDVQGWSGVAAQEFRTKFLEPFPAIAHNQFLLVAALKSALEAEQAMWKSARNDIWKIAEDTYNYLNHMNDCNKNDAVVTFTVVASICTIATVNPGPLAIAVTAIGAVASAGADVVGLETAPTTEISGTGVKQVMASMHNAVDKMVHHINETEDRIRKAVASLSDQIHQAQSSSNPDNHLFYTRRPSLADSNKRTIKNDMGYTD